MASGKRNICVASISREPSVGRGGPGIVLASVAFDAGIINAKFYTALVLVAVITSQFAGTWLEYVLYRGWPLLSTDKLDSQIALQGDDPVAAYHRIPFLQHLSRIDEVTCSKMMQMSEDPQDKGSTLECRRRTSFEHANLCRCAGSTAGLFNRVANHRTAQS